MPSTSLSPTEFSPPRLWVRAAAVLVAVAALAGIWRGVDRQLKAERVAGLVSSGSPIAAAEPVTLTDEPVPEPAVGPPPPTAVETETAQAAPQDLGDADQAPAAEQSEGPGEPASSPEASPPTALQDRGAQPSAETDGETAQEADEPPPPNDERTEGEPP